GQLGSARIRLAGGEFAVGDRVVLKLNDRRLEVENGNRGRVIAADAAAGVLDVELADGRIITLPRAYLDRKTAIGDPTLVHGYAGTAHIAQGITTGRAFVLGSDTSYREWGYVAWSRARLQTRFYICEPDADEAAGEHHTAASPERTAFDDVVGAMERSRAQHTATELVDGATINRLKQHVRAHATQRSHRAPAVRSPTTTRAAVASEPAQASGKTDTRRPAVGEAIPTRSASPALVARRDPPAYVLVELGERPVQPRHAAAWDVAVERIERYRTEHGITDTDDALGPRPSGLRAHVAWRDARRTIGRARTELVRPGLPVDSGEASSPAFSREGLVASRRSARSAR
ncbi:MAG: hypothetical protein LC790_17870, partial [Actinobacteria bacterium]|nr:hypothetical protein [Actinomycetota bacterium]